MKNTIASALRRIADRLAGPEPKYIDLRRALVSVAVDTATGEPTRAAIMVPLQLLPGEKHYCVGVSR
jgi:hypothetical protein